METVASRYFCRRSWPATLPQPAQGSGRHSMDTCILSRPTPSARPLAGKVAIVTGSTSGIGFAIAGGLAAAGAAIVLNGFGKPAEIDAALFELTSAFGVEAMHSAADMSDALAIEAMVTDAMERW